MNNGLNASPEQHNVFKEGMNRFQIIKSREIEKYYFTETIKFSAVIGPLYCLSSNMQQMNKHYIHSTLNIHKHVSNNGKFKLFSVFQLKNLPTNTIFLPFRPTFYLNYRDCLANMFRQGLPGLYKGNMYRLLFITSTNKLKQYFDMILIKQSKLNKFYKIIKEIFFYSLADIILSPLLFIESRYSIQNRRKGFRVYNNLLSVIKLSWKELYKASLYSIPRNMFFILGLNVYFLYPCSQMQNLSIFLAHFLSYPLLTIQRNGIYQSNYIGYFPKSDNKIPILFYLIDNFGITSLYRGFMAYITAVALWHYFVPKLAKSKFYENAFKDQKEKENLFKLSVFEDDDENEE